jgi:hypothetical protein
MSRALFEAAPMTAEIDLRLRRVENRLNQIEATAHDHKRPSRLTEPAPARHTRWTEIANRLDALALKVKLHYEQAGRESAPPALDELRDSVQNAFTAVGNAIHDDAVRADARDVGMLVGTALADALSTVGKEFREAVRR